MKFFMAGVSRQDTGFTSLRLFGNFAVGLAAQQINGQVARVADGPDFRKVDAADDPVFVR